MKRHKAALQFFVCYNAMVNVQKNVYWEFLEYWQILHVFLTDVQKKYGFFFNSVHLPFYMYSCQKSIKTEIFETATVYFIISYCDIQTTTDLRISTHD